MSKSASPPRYFDPAQEHMDSAGPRPPAVVIAAGGLGSRMGGAKPSAMLGGRTLLDHAIRWSARQSDCLALAVGASMQTWPTGLPALVDQTAEIGPISALVSAFSFAERAGRSHVLLVACDMPFLPAGLLAHLGTSIGDAAVAMPESSGKLQPMAALWRTDGERLNAYVQEGGRSPRGFAHAVGMIAVHWPPTDHDPFRSINTREDLNWAEAFVRTEWPLPSRPDRHATRQRGGE